MQSPPGTFPLLCFVFLNVKCNHHLATQHQYLKMIQIWIQEFPYKRTFLNLNKSVINKRALNKLPIVHITYFTPSNWQVPLKKCYILSLVGYYINFCLSNQLFTLYYSLHRKDRKEKRSYTGIRRFTVQKKKSNFLRKKIIATFKCFPFKA